MLRTITAVLVALGASAAVANVDTIGPIGGKTNDQQLDGGNEKFLMELRRRLESRGYGKVEILPSMFVTTAQNQNGTR